jgi:hypothetical protein
MCWHHTLAPLEFTSLLLWGAAIRATINHRLIDWVSSWTTRKAILSLSSNERRSLVRAYQTARQRERMAWAYLQNTRATCTSAEREQHLRDWLEAMRAIELQLQLTASIVISVTEGLRECAQTTLAVQRRPGASQ